MPTKDNPKSPKDGSKPAKDRPKQTERDRLTQQVAIMQKAVKAQNTARDLRDRAKKIANPQERERMFKEAYAKEVEANGQSKLAQRMQSGAWQGFGLGGGIGAGTGLGLGAVVGTLVGGLVSIPTTGLGMLIGTGVGIAHGPFIKLGGGEKKHFEDAMPEEVVDAIETGRIEELPDDAAAQSPQPKRKPRKLEIRSQGRAEAQLAPTEPIEAPTPDMAQEDVSHEEPTDPSDAVVDAPAREPSRTRKPRKIQVRSRPRAETFEQSTNANGQDGTSDA